MSAAGLTFAERPAASAPQGLLLAHHGRGTDERELLTLAEVLDPRHRWHVIAPRAPLPEDAGEGHRWYLVPERGHPDPATFERAVRTLAAFHDEAWARSGVPPSRTVLAGFSMGAVMSYALGLAADRPAPAGIMALSGFMPPIPGWEPDVAARRGLPVFVAHGRQDTVLPVQYAREAVQRLKDGGVDVEYRESDARHRIDPRELPAAALWLERRLPAQ